jgi:hypothetical protein
VLKQLRTKIRRIQESPECAQKPHAVKIDRNSEQTDAPFFRKENVIRAGRGSPEDVGPRDIYAQPVFQSNTPGARAFSC